MSHTQLFNIASSYLGLEEFPGARHNPAIIAMYAASNNGWVQDDETPWCAAFVGAVLAQAGLKGTSSLAARSYLDWGQEVPLDNAQKGDIVVLWRGSRDGWQGHVAFLDRIEGNMVYLLGGNQGNKVSVAPYPIERVLGVRRKAEPRSTPAASRTVQATVAQVGAGAAAGVTAISALDGTAQLVALGGTAVVLVAALVIFRERLKKWKQGDR